MNPTLRRVFTTLIVLTIAGLTAWALPAANIQASELQQGSETSNTSEISEQTAPVLNAVGRVELVGRHQVVLETSGKIDRLAAQVGDFVKAGDLLVALDSSLLEAAMERAEISLETARIGLEELTDEPEASDIAVAEANLLQAKENLALVADGPTPEELQAQANSVEAAWARHALLMEGPTQAKINQAQAAFAQAEVDLQKAQHANMTRSPGCLRPRPRTQPTTCSEPPSPTKQPRLPTRKPSSRRNGPICSPH